MTLLAGLLGILAGLFKSKKQKQKGTAGAGIGRHQRAHKARIHRPRLSKTHKPGKPDLSGSKASVAKRRSNHYITGVYNVANRKLKRTRLL